MTKNNILRYIKKHPQSRVIASVLAFIFIGTLVLAFSRAATPTASIEAENQNASLSCASRTSSDITASGGGAVKFGCNTVTNDLVIVSPKNELDAVKQAVTTGNKKAYWDYIKTQKAARAGGGSTTPLIPTDWTSVKWIHFTGTEYTFDPRTFYAENHTNQASVDTKGSFMLSGAINAYTCGLRWYFDVSAEATACGDYAVNYLDSWATNFQYARSRSSIDIRDNQVKLNSGWYLANLTKAAEVLWNHPSFTTEKKQKFADWLWTAFLNEDAEMNEVSSEVLGVSGAGWNGRTLMMQARLNAALVMKAAGHQSGQVVIDDIQSKVDLYLPEILYYGKQPWHEVLGQPWPNQAYRHLSTNYAGNNTATGTRDYWFFAPSSVLPPPFFVGQTQETGRDVGHQQNGIGSISEVFRALRLNGYQDRYIQNDLGSILLQMGERHAKIYNEALDEFWGGGYATVDSLTCTWLPSEWTTLQLSTKSTSCPEISFKIGGASADFGWEYLRNELKLKGYSTPELDRLTSRLRGTGTKSSTNAAGVGYVRTTNHQAWEPLFGNY